MPVEMEWVRGIPSCAVGCLAGVRLRFRRGRRVFANKKAAF